MKIRKATIQDIESIVRIARMWTDNLGFIPKDRYMCEVDGRRHGSLNVADDSGVIIGFIHATHRNGQTKIQQIAVLKGYEGQGYAHDLLDSISGKTLICRCGSNLTHSIAFWEKEGFKIKERIKVNNTRGRDILVMQKENQGTTEAEFESLVDKASHL